MARAVTERADALPALGEVFREHGYSGASLAIISEATGLGKGSLYHFFPGGKAEMAEAVLAEIEAWFTRRIFEPLRAADAPAAAVTAMFENVTAYFNAGRRICLVGALALGDPEEVFAAAVARYFRLWIEALAALLTRAGVAGAEDLAEQVVGEIQGIIVLTKALDDTAVFARRIGDLERRVLARIA